MVDSKCCTQQFTDVQNSKVRYELNNKGWKLHSGIEQKDEGISIQRWESESVQERNISGDFQRVRRKLYPPITHTHTYYSTTTNTIAVNNDTTPTQSHRRMDERERIHQPVGGCLLRHRYHRTNSEQEEKNDKKKWLKRWTERKDNSKFKIWRVRESDGVRKWIPFICTLCNTPAATDALLIISFLFLSLTLSLSHFAFFCSSHSSTPLLPWQDIKRYTTRR